MIKFNGGFDPKWDQYNGLELSCVVENKDEGYCETVQSGEYDFISLYVHLKAGGVDCLHDFEPNTPKDEILNVVYKLLYDHKQLREFGLSDNTELVDVTNVNLYSIIDSRDNVIGGLKDLSLFEAEMALCNQLNYGVGGWLLEQVLTEKS